MTGTITPTSATPHIAVVTRAAGDQSVDAKPVVEFGKSQSLPKLVSLAADLARLGPPVDYAKIAQIRQAIASGTYEIDLKATAAAILGYDRIERDSL